MLWHDFVGMLTVLLSVSVDSRGVGASCDQALELTCGDVVDSPDCPKCIKTQEEKLKLTGCTQALMDSFCRGAIDIEVEI